jgi:hypothetical protein
VLEVGRKGLLLNQTGGRGDSIDIVVRFPRESARKIQAVVKDIPAVVYKYPLAEVGLWYGVMHLTDPEQAELVKHPAKPIASGAAMDEYISTHHTGDVDLLLEEVMRGAAGKKAPELKNLTFKLRPIICSHFVNAMLHVAFYPKLSVMSALTDVDRFRVSPAQMWRLFLLNHGVWCNKGAEIEGVQRLGLFDSDLSLLFAKDFSKHDALSA